MADPLQSPVGDGEGGSRRGEHSSENEVVEKVFHRPGPEGANEGEAGAGWLCGAGDGSGAPYVRGCGVTTVS